MPIFVSRPLRNFVSKPLSDSSKPMLRRHGRVQTQWTFHERHGLNASERAVILKCLDVPGLQLELKTDDTDTDGRVDSGSVELLLRIIYTYINIYNTHSYLYFFVYIYKQFDFQAISYSNIHSISSRNVHVEHQYNIEYK